MPAKNQALTLTYTAWNTASQTGQPADAANHTLRVVVDGTEGAVAATPVEVNPATCPGEYNVALTAANVNGKAIKFAGRSSTAGVVIIPIPFFTDGGVLPPSAAPGSAGGLPTADAANGVKLSVGTGTGQVNLASGKVPATLASGDVTGNVTCVLAAAGLDAVVIETSLNARQALSIIAAESAGKLAGGGTTSIAFAGAGVTTNRITATVDSSGNRTAVLISPPA